MGNKDKLVILICFGLIVCCGAESFDKTVVPPGNGYGDQVYFGYEYDMHANEGDTDLGKHKPLSEVFSCCPGSLSAPALVNRARVTE